MGGWKLTPDMLSSGWLEGARGFVAAPSRPTCLVVQPGCVYDYAIVCANLGTRICRPQVVDDSNPKVHLPVELPILAEGRPAWVRRVVEPVPFPTVPPIECE
eukprot:2233402-Pyramimonas_sp.AAC.1